MLCRNLSVTWLAQVVRFKSILVRWTLDYERTLRWFSAISRVKTSDWDLSRWNSFDRLDDAVISVNFFFLIVHVLRTILGICDRNMRKWFQDLEAESFRLDDCHELEGCPIPTTILSK